MLFLNDRDIAMYFYRDCNQLDIFKKYKNSDLINISDILKELIVLQLTQNIGNNKF